MELAVSRPARRKVAQSSKNRRSSEKSWLREKVNGKRLTELALQGEVWLRQELTERRGNSEKK